MQSVLVLPLVGEAELMIGKEVGEARNLFETQKLVPVHADVLHYPFVRHACAGEFADDVAHQLHVVHAAGAVMADGGGHAVGEVLVYHGGEAD